MRIRKIVSVGDDNLKSTGKNLICSADALARQALGFPRSVSNNKAKDSGSIRFLFYSGSNTMNWLKSKNEGKIVRPQERVKRPAK